jgi:hypothetical protein
VRRRWLGAVGEECAQLVRGSVCVDWGAMCSAGLSAVAAAPVGGLGGRVGSVAGIARLKCGGVSSLGTSLAVSGARGERLILMPCHD